MDYKEHYSVLNKECIDILTQDIDTSDFEKVAKIIIADLTFGAGGHSFAFLRRDPRIHLVSFDQDPEALENGRKNIEELGFSDRITLVDSNFENFKSEVEKIFGEDASKSGVFYGVLMDLGVSSHHFDKEDRGFSFRFDAPLDMRMDVDNDNIKTAAQILETIEEQDLISLIRDYSEEKHAYRIALNIIEKRKQDPIKTTKELEDIVFHSYPKKERFGKTNPATKTFQALRIAVNRELDVLSELLSQVLPFVKVGGKIAAISFHSLEDRIIKRAFKEMSLGETPVDIITKKPIIPSKEEILENSRSRSAKLRIVQRVLVKKSKNKYSKFSKQ